MSWLKIPLEVTLLCSSTNRGQDAMSALGLD
jgi:hypothetical protein